VKRVRQRGQRGDYRFYVTTKRVISDLVRAEEEAQISSEQYLELLMTADTTLHQIRKDRYCLDYNDLIFELDVYPFWEDKAILEVELNSEFQEISLPDYIIVIKEVTEDSSYSNHSIAKMIPV
jgi:CYTH domain-containing protein